MGKQFYKATIEDIQNDGCDECEKEVLCDVFEYAMKKTACTLARKAWFNLADFHRAAERGIEDFTLMIEKSSHAGAEQWKGTFEAKSRTLRVMGMLERG